MTGRTRESEVRIRLSVLELKMLKTIAADTLTTPPLYLRKLFIEQLRSQRENENNES